MATTRARSVGLKIDEGPGSSLRRRIDQGPLSSLGSVPQPVDQGPGSSLGSVPRMIGPGSSIDQGPGSSLGSVPQPPDLGPGSSVLSAPGAGPRPLTYEPGGGYAPYDPLTSISTGRPYGEAGYAMPAWSPPTPPSRPSGLGGVLSKAVQPAVVSRAAAPAPAAAPAGPPQSNAFTTITAPNSNPTDRNRPQMGALNLSGLLGGLFGGGGAAPQPAPPPPPARGAVASGGGAVASGGGAVASGGRGGGVGSPDMTGVIFDQNGNPTWNGLDASILSAPGLQQQDPTQLAATVGRPGWWKPLR